jgi:hypothetical protein
MASPRLAALRIWQATTESAMSRRIGCPPGLGTQKPTGLLPSIAAAPGAMVVEALRR